MKLPLTLTLAAIVCQTFAKDAIPADDESAALKAAATAFCTEVHREHIEGLPSPDALQRLSPLITPELRAAIERARTLQQQQIRTHPDDKPDWIEGDLFSSLFEGVSSWELGEVFTAPTVDGTVVVKQTYAEPEQKPVTWSDTLIFKQHGKRWLLNDIIMGGKWQFSAGTTLRNRLPGGIKKSQDHDSPDGAWRVTFKREDDDLKSVTITNKKGAAKPTVLFGHKTDGPCIFTTWLIWSLDGQMLALRPGDNPRFTDTRVFRLVNRQWAPVTLPEFYSEEKKTLAANKFRERENLNDAAYWQDAGTLVIHYFGDFTNGDDGDGFDKLISVHVGKDGKTSIVGALDTPSGY